MKEEWYVVDMYRDAYYPKHLVDRVKEALQRVDALLATGERQEKVIQAAFDRATIEINELAELFEAENSEIETVARDSIAVTVIDMLDHYDISLDVEDALQERDW